MAIADETFIAAPFGSTVPLIADQANWRRWWPDLRLQVTEDRESDGVRWIVSGAVSGTMEFWIEPRMDGMLVHYFLHGEPSAQLPPGGRARWDELARLVRARRVQGRLVTRELKAGLELGRLAGEPAAGESGSHG